VVSHPDRPSAQSHQAHLTMIGPYNITTCMHITHNITSQIFIFDFDVLL